WHARCSGKNPAPRSSPSRSAIQRSGEWAGAFELRPRHERTSNSKARSHMMDERPPIRIELFAGPRVRVGEGNPKVLQPKPGALLALLALRPGVRQTRDELAEALWPDEPPEVTRGRLRVALATLKRAIPPDTDLILA